MSYGQMDLLFSDRLAPITTSMGFIQGDCSLIASKFIKWREGIKKHDRYTRSITHRTVIGNLEQTPRSLLPLKMVQVTHYIFIPTIGEWTAFFDNGSRGTDPTAISYLPILSESTSVWVVAVPHTLQFTGTSWQGRHGALIMDVYGHENSDRLNLIRRIRLENDAGKWEFIQSGEPFPFEETERYQAKQLKDRFDFNMLKRYLEAFSLSPFEEDFYLPLSDRRAVLVEITTKNPERNKDVSLEEARHLNRIEG